jgi:hypothetical protein
MLNHGYTACAITTDPEPLIWLSVTTERRQSHSLTVCMYQNIVNVANFALQLSVTGIMPEICRTLAGNGTHTFRACSNVHTVQTLKLGITV